MEVCCSLMDWGKQGNTMEILHWQKGEDLSPDHRNFTILFHPRHTLNATLPKKIFKKLVNFVMKSSKRKKKKSIILQKCIL